MKEYNCPDSPRILLQYADEDKISILDSTDFEEEYKKNVFFPYVEKLFKVLL